MRASTIFALCLALLVGLAAAVVNRLVNFKPPVAEVKVVTPSVLVAGRNIFAGDLIQPAWVKVRPMRPEEEASFAKTKDLLLPPVAEAVYLRVALANLRADEPILKDHLQEFAKPESLSKRLLPNARAVGVAVSKDRCAGGLIQVGEWVDVLLTSVIDHGEGSPVGTQTAVICPRVRILAKRNQLWPVFQAISENEVQFTLELNTYRASLMEFARTKGALSLVPVSSLEQSRLETRRKDLLEQGVAGRLVSLSSESGEDTEEEKRIAKISTGDSSVGQDDLARIFALKPIPAIKDPGVTVQQMSGTQSMKPAVFQTVSSSREEQSKGISAGLGSGADFRFRAPDAPAPSKSKR
jgi:Flp pilus assembly protein CpaB